MEVSYSTMIAAGNLVKRLAQNARRLEKALAETMNTSAEWKRIADELKAERNAARAEIERLKKPRQHPVKVGESVRRTTEGSIAPIGTLGRVLVVWSDAYQVELRKGFSTMWAFDDCTPCDPPGSTHAEPDMRWGRPDELRSLCDSNEWPDLTQLHAKGKEAWSDVPNATQWVEDMRGNTEASHDTPAGKEAAEELSGIPR